MAPLSDARYDNWIVWIAFLPALFTLSAIGITAAMAWHNQVLWRGVTLSAIPDYPDDYVHELAKLGIANLPGYQPPSARESNDPIVAGK